MNFKNKIKSIYHGYKNLIIEDKEFEPLYKDRYSICLTCPSNKVGICNLCGCVLKAKTRSLEEDCPHPNGSKWNPKLRIDNNILFRLRRELPENLHKYFENEIISEEQWKDFIKHNEKEKE